MQSYSSRRRRSRDLRMRKSPVALYSTESSFPTLYGLDSDWMTSTTHWNASDAVAAVLMRQTAHIATRARQSSSHSCLADIALGLPCGAAANVRTRHCISRSAVRRPMLPPRAGTQPLAWPLLRSQALLLASAACGPLRNPVRRPSDARLPFSLRRRRCESQVLGSASRALSTALLENAMNAPTTSCPRPRT